MPHWATALHLCKKEVIPAYTPFELAESVDGYTKSGLESPLNVKLRE